MQDSPLCFQTNYRANILVVEWPPPEGPWKFVSKKPTGNVKGLEEGAGTAENSANELHRSERLNKG